jgi:hypothetical protein
MMQINGSAVLIQFRQPLKRDRAFSARRLFSIRFVGRPAMLPSGPPDLLYQPIRLDRLALPDDVDTSRVGRRLISHGPYDTIMTAP